MLVHVHHAHLSVLLHLLVHHLVTALPDNLAHGQGRDVLRLELRLAKSPQRTSLLEGQTCWLDMLIIRYVDMSTWMKSCSCHEVFC